MGVFGVHANSFTLTAPNKRHYDSTDMVDAADEMPESMLPYAAWPSPIPPREDDGEDEDTGDDDEVLCVRRMAPAALQWGRGPGSGV